MNIARVFDSAASDYDTTRRKYISCFDDFYGVAIEQIPYQKNDVFNILDLGAGTGLFSALIRNAFPNAQTPLGSGLTFDIPAYSLYSSPDLNDWE